MYVDNFCSTTSLLLEGTDDVGTVDDVVMANSDGYKAVSTISLDAFFAGGRAAWRGTCIVYYASDLV